MRSLSRLSSMNPSRGLAIVAVLGAIFLGLTMMMGMIRFSQMMSQSANQQTSRVQSDFQTDALTERVRSTILREVQLAMANHNPSDPLSLSGALMRELISDDLLLESGEKIISLRCLGQGVSPQLDVCTSDDVLPKIYEFSVQTTGSALVVTSVIQSEIQIQNSGLSNYAFFIKNEPSDSVTLGPAEFSGIFGVNFAPRPNGSNQPPQKRVLFLPGDGEIRFKNAFITNLAQPQQQLDMTHGSRVHFERGVISKPDGVGFQSLSALHSQLIETGIQARQVERAECSKLILMNNPQNPQLTYQEFEDRDCSFPSAEPELLAPQDNQAVFARGRRVILEADDESRNVAMNNIAIVAQGDVELRSSVVRNPELSSGRGYLTVMTTGDLVIPSQMKSLLPGSPPLANVTSTPLGDEPTIQIDLSYISINPGPSEGSYGGSVRFDESLRNASGPENAVNLGRAVFSGLFISEKTPQSRLMFSGSNAIDGFGQVQWKFPSAISAIGTDWFNAQLSGGALRATVTRYERRGFDRQQALKSYSEVIQ